MEDNLALLNEWLNELIETVAHKISQMQMTPMPLLVKTANEVSLNSISLEFAVFY